jgi:hypothetical protein
MYHDFSNCGRPTSRNASGFPTERATRWSTRSAASDPIGRQRPDHPRERGTPVVTDHVCAFDPEMVQHTEHVDGEERQRVRLDVGGLV